MQTVGRRGLVQQAYSAIDTSPSGTSREKAANLPVYKTAWRGRASRVPPTASDTAWLWMTPEQIAEASQPYIEQGLMGIKVKGRPEARRKTADRLTRLARSPGARDIWARASMPTSATTTPPPSFLGVFLEEEIGADWFEETAVVRGT